MADGGITQRIALEGGDEITSKLASIGQAGEQAFSGMRQAAEQVRGSFEKAFEPLGALRDKLSSIGSMLGIGLVAGSGGAVVGLLELVKSSASAIYGLQGLAQQSGTTVEEMSGLSSALSSFGVKSEDLGTGFKRLAVRVESEWSTIRAAIRNAASVIVADNLSIQSSMLSLEKAEIDFGNVRHDNARKQIANTQSVRAARLSLAELEYKNAVLEGRRQPDEELEAKLDLEKRRLELAERRQKLADAIRKEEQDKRDAPIREEQAQIALEQAQIAAREARKKQTDDQANSIQSLVSYVNDLAKAGKAAGESMVDIVRGPATSGNVNVTPENIVKGIIASVGPGVSALGEFKGGLEGIAAAAPEQMKVLLKLSDVFKGMPDGALKTATAVQLFGRGVGPEFIRALSQGSGAILDAKKRLEDLGLTYTKEEGAQAASFERSKNTLVDYLSVIKSKIGIAFAPAATQFLTAFKDLAVENFGSIEKTAKSMGQSASAAVQGFINVVKGVSFDDFAKSGAGLSLAPEQLLKVGSWQASIESIKGSITGFITGVQAAFGSLNGILDSVAAGINKVFGTNLSGKELGIGFLVGQFTGLNAIVLDIVKTIGILTIAVVAMGRAMVTAFLPITLAIGAVTALVDLVKELRKQWQEWNSEKAGPEQQKELDEAPSAQKDFVPRPNKWVRPPKAEGGGADGALEGGGAGQRYGSERDVMLEALRRVGALARPEEFAAAIAGATPSTNIEDRRSDPPQNLTGFLGGVFESLLSSFKAEVKAPIEPVPPALSGLARDAGVRGDNLAQPGGGAAAALDSGAAPQSALSKVTGMVDETTAIIGAKVAQWGVWLGGLAFPKVPGLALASDVVGAAGMGAWAVNSASMKADIRRQAQAAINSPEGLDPTKIKLPEPLTSMIAALNNWAEIGPRGRINSAFDALGTGANAEAGGRAASPQDRIDEGFGALNSPATRISDAFSALGEKLASLGSITDRLGESLAASFKVEALPGLGGAAGADAAAARTPVYIQFKDSTVGPVFADDQILAALQRLANSGQLDSTGNN